MWPSSAVELADAQRRVAVSDPPLWRYAPGPEAAPLAIGACAVCFARGGAGGAAEGRGAQWRGARGRGARGHDAEACGAAGEPAWAAAAVLRGRRPVAHAVVTGEAGAPYEAGLLALREGPLLQAAVEALAVAPDVLLVDATGRDHPRRAGLALHLGAMLGLPTVGVTHRPLLAVGPWPADEDGATAPLTLDGEPVGAWLRTRRGARPVAVHPGWRTDADTAVAVVLAASRGHRTPEPLRHARRHARVARGRR